MNNMASVNVADDRAILLHEFGHTFADLADEYVDNSFYTASSMQPEKYPNCDFKGCGKWSGTGGTGCYAGCMLSAYYRPTQASIMRAPYRTTDFGPLNSEEIIRRIMLYETQE
jgi:hypothetical protein